MTRDWQKQAVRGKRKVPKDMKKEVRSKKETSEQRRAWFPFGGSVSKEGSQKNMS